MRSAIIILMALSIGACASLDNAGSASYYAKPVADKSGNLVCCEVSIKNGKEVANVEVHLEKSGTDLKLDVKEQGVLAFQGQEIAAGATQAAIEKAAKAAAAAALAPYIPMLLPYAGAALSSPGLGAAAVGAGAVLGEQKVIGK